MTSGILEEIQRLRARRNAAILAHNYQRPEIQDLADMAARAPQDRPHAAAGARYISMGALTHAAPAVGISFDIELGATSAPS